MEIKWYPVLSAWSHYAKLLLNQTLVSLIDKGQIICLCVCLNEETSYIGQSYTFLEFRTSISCLVPQNWLYKNNLKQKIGDIEANAWFLGPERRDAFGKKLIARTKTPFTLRWSGTDERRGICVPQSRWERVLYPNWGPSRG